MPQGRKVGIRQQKVRVGKAEVGKTSTRTFGGSGKSGHRISRKQGAQSSVEAEASLHRERRKGRKEPRLSGGLVGSEPEGAE